MSKSGNFVRFAAAASASLAIVIGSSSTPHAQAVPPIDKRITYILPQWLEFLSVPESDVQSQAARLRSRLGEGPRVRVGFTVYISVSMSPVYTTDAAAVRVALASTFAQMDEAIARARSSNIPICLSFVTAIRNWTDPLQE